MTEKINSSSERWPLRIRRLIHHTVNFVFPPVCANCKKPGELLCSECRVTVPWLTEPVCLHCGRVVSQPSERCPACLNRPLLPIDQVRAAVIFSEPIPDLIHKLKYNGFFALAEPLAGLMVDAWPRWEVPVDLVVSVPLHPNRLKTRGYNQSDLLVTHFCQRLDLAGNRQALRRVRNTPPQVGLNASERQNNVSNAFQADGELVAGKDILLVDDVCTTGSTLQAAAQALIDAGARRVSGYCLARAL